MQDATAWRFYRVDEMQRMFGFKTKQTLYNWMKDGTLPRHFKIGARAVRWAADEVDAVAAARRAGKGQEEIRALVSSLHAARAANLAQPAGA